MFCFSRFLLKYPSSLCGAEDETKSLVHIGQCCAAELHHREIVDLWLRNKADSGLSNGAVSSVTSHVGQLSKRALYLTNLSVNPAVNQLQLVPIYSE